MNWTQELDHYCERTASGFGAEPLNMVTGLAFAVLAVWLFTRHRGPDARATAAALMLVGLSSFLWHGYGQLWASVLNLVSNMLLMGALGWFALHRLAGLRHGRALLGGVVLAALFYQGGAALGRAVPALAAAGGYPGLVALTLLAAVALHRTRRVALALGIAAILLAAGLPIRLNDAAWCGTFPNGTHMLWHLMNAAYMALLLLAAIEAARMRDNEA